MGDSATDKVKEAVKDNAVGDDDGKLVAPLKKAAVTAAVAALTPVIKNAVTNAAESAVKKAPEMLAGAGGIKGVAELAKDKLGGEDGGGAGSLVKGAVGAVTGGGGGGAAESGDAPDGTGSGRRMPVQQAVDVAAPIDIVYNQFTQFEEFPKFMHRVESVEQSDDGHVTFRSKQWKVNRQWQAQIIDQRPDERIAWRSTSGVNLSGVATFHELAPRLTRIELNVDFDPEGFFEKIGRGMRFAKRSIRADLHRFKAYVEMEESEDGEWRGFVVDGEAVEEEEYFGEDPEAVDEDGEEPVAEEDLDDDEELLEDEPVAEEDLDEAELEDEEVLDEEAVDEELDEEAVAQEELDDELATGTEDAPEAEEPVSARSARGRSSRSKNGSKASTARGDRSRSSSSGGAAAKSGGGGRSRASGRSNSSSSKKASKGGSSRGRAKAGSSS